MLIYQRVSDDIRLGTLGSLMVPLKWFQKLSLQRGPRKEWAWLIVESKPTNVGRGVPETIYRHKFWKPQGPYTNKAQMIFSQEYPKVSAQNQASCPIIQVLSAHIPANRGRPGTLKQLQWPKKPLSAMGGRLGPPVATGCGNWNVDTMAGSLAHDSCLYKNLYDLVWLVCTYSFIYIYIWYLYIYIYVRVCVCVVYGINMHWHAMFSLFPSLSLWYVYTYIATSKIIEKTEPQTQVVVPVTVLPFW